MHIIFTLLQIETVLFEGKHILLGVSTTIAISLTPSSSKNKNDEISDDDAMKIEFSSPDNLQSDFAKRTVPRKSLTNKKNIAPKDIKRNFKLQSTHRVIVSVKRSAMEERNNKLNNRKCVLTVKT